MADAGRVRRHFRSFSGLLVLSLALGSLAVVVRAAVTAPPAGASASCSVDTTSPYARAVIADRPLEYYPLDQSAGQPLCDASGHSNNGTFAASGVTFGVPGPIAGTTDDALSSPGRIDIATSAGDSGVVAPHDFTLEGWFRTTTQQDELVVSIGLGGAPHAAAGLGVWDSEGAPTVRWDTYDGSTGLPTGDVDPYDGRWYFVAGSYDARSEAVTLYLDGKRLGTSPMPSDPTPSTVRIGYWVDTVYNQPFEGSLAQIAVFDAALSATQIAAQWRLGAQGGAQGVSSLASSLPTPAQAFSDPGAVAASVAVAAGGTLFITFPAQLFNLTFQENYDLIAGWLRRRRWFGLRRATDGRSSTTGGAHTGGQGAAEEAGAPAPSSGWVSWRAELPAFAAVIVVGALLGSLLDPSFGANARTGEVLLGIALANVTGIFVAGYVTDRYHRRRGKTVVKHLHALPWGLLIALFCVIVSRISSFEPGYLYGVVCAVVFERQLQRTEAGHVAALSVLAVLAVSVLAWIVWIPVDHAASGSSDVALIVFDDFLAAVFVGGIVGSTVGMLPLRFLAGGTIKEWSTAAWAALFGLALFTLIDFVVRSPAASSSHSPFVLTVVLFLVFGGLSVGLREYFARRWRREHHVEIHGFRARLHDLFSARTPEEGKEFVLAGGSSGSAVEEVEEVEEGAEGDGVGRAKPAAGEQGSSAGAATPAP